MKETLKKAQRPIGKQVRLRLVYVDYWSVLKLGFLVGVVLAVVQMVAATLVYLLLFLTGLLASVASLVSDVSGGALDVGMLVSLPSVLLFILITSALNVVVISALAAVGAVIYNIAVRISGGILVGFTND